MKHHETLENSPFDAMISVLDGDIGARHRVSGDIGMEFPAIAELVTTELLIMEIWVLFPNLP